MKIIAFNGSPRGANGNTHIMVENFLQGAARAGAETENILLAQKHIKHCTGCFSCWTKTPGKCVIDDDMAGLLEKYIASDIAVYATPLYVDYVSGIMKDFIDRRLPLVCPEFEKDGDNETVHKKRFKKYPAMIMMANCGFPEQAQFELLKLYCKRRSSNNKVNVIAQIYRSQGELLKDAPPEIKPRVDNYKALLQEAGRSIAETTHLPGDIQASLKEPLIPEEEYARLVNESW
jgi:NAD(P)H-dependent FMN reductase